VIVVSEPDDTVPDASNVFERMVTSPLEDVPPMFASEPPAEDVMLIVVPSGA
jgi:hypothetical protein